jgi:UDP-N-acetylglucosamine 4,6-dehydratase/5-epimerase
MITASDSFNTVDLGRYFAILPSAGAYTPETYAAAHGGEPVAPGYAYNSGTNPDFLSVAELRELIREQIDPSFCDT